MSEAIATKFEDTLVESTSIQYQEGYKYQLYKDLVINTGIKGFKASLEYITLYENGFMVIKRGYAWDGASGPTFDTKSSFRCSAAHDALYQICRIGYIPMTYQPKFDKLLERLGVEDGMWSIRAHFWERALNKFGGDNLRPSGERPVLIAP